MSDFDELDHSTLRVNDLILTYRFYKDILGEVLGGCDLDTLSRLTTEEIVGRDSQWARMAAATAEEPIHGAATSHGAVTLGRAHIPVFLRNKHLQEPPPEQLRGSPRMAFAVSQAQLERAIELMRSHWVAFEGPVEHRRPCPAERSIYFKDPSSNFLELCVSRANQKKEGGVSPRASARRPS